MKDDRLYIIHILERIHKIEEYTNSGYQDFIASSLQQDAVIRNLEVIGEAVKNISDRLKQAYPDVPWRRIAGLRDLLIHRYMGVDVQEVWNIIEKDIPELKEAVRRIDDEITPH
ncbi:MAG: DUF86 domain-containing protein [Methanoregulaceae archaeon]